MIDDWGRLAGWVRTGLGITDTAIFVYFVLLNSSYLGLLLLAAAEFFRHLRRVPFNGLEDLFRSPLTPAVSVLMPAYNEAPGSWPRCRR